MKQFFVLTLLFISANIMAQTLIVSPENPMPGEMVELSFEPSETLKVLDVTAYLFAPDKPNAVEVRMVPDGKIFRGKLKLLNDTKAVLLSIENEAGETVDDNEKKGYKFLCYKADRKTAVEGGHAAKAYMYGNYGYLGGIDRNREKALNLMKTEFRLYPTSKEDVEYFRFYSLLGQRLSDEDVATESKLKFEEISKMESPSEADLGLAIELGRNLKLDQEIAPLLSNYNSLFPNGKILQNDLRKEFNNASSLEEKLELFNQFENQFANAEGAEKNKNSFCANIAGQYAKLGDWENFDKYISLITNPSRKANSLNAAAWGLSGGGLDDDAKDVDLGKKYSAKSLEIIQTVIDNPNSTDRLVQFTEKQWIKSFERTYAMYSDTYALLTYKDGDAIEALKFQQLACEADDFQNAELNERYSAYMEMAIGAPETEEFISEMIAKGLASNHMKAQHKRLFLESNTLESAYNKYATELQKTADANLKKELEEKIIEEESPDFQLVNIEGDKVSLEGLRGKIVVVDFWATWCGPCKASFPGMQKAVDKYSERDDVEFVFVNTWERVADKKQNAADFIASKNYRFNVLMDEENKMVTDFGVAGIPTKFILDKAGNIRFKSVGFNGNDEELVKELSLMIEMADSEGKVGVSGAP